MAQDGGAVDSINGISFHCTRPLCRAVTWLVKRIDGLNEGCDYLPDLWRNYRLTAWRDRYRYSRWSNTSHHGRWSRWSMLPIRRATTENPPPRCSLLAWRALKRRGRSSRDPLISLRRRHPEMRSVLIALATLAASEIARIDPFL